MVLVRRVFLIPIQSGRTDKFSFPAFVGQYGTDVIGQILQIPLIDKAIDLAAFFVRLVRSVHMVHDGNEANAPFNKFPMQIFFHQFHITRKARLCFCQNDIKFVLAGRFNHPVESRTGAVNARIILIAVDLINIVSLFDRIMDQHGFLVLDALRFSPTSVFF